MKNRAQKLIAAFSAGFNVRHIAAAVSGGADSVAMLLLLHQFCRMKKIRLCVFHVDHALRDASAEDRKWVGQLAAGLGLDFFWRRAAQTDLDAAKNARSEAWARDFRYNCFAQMCKESGVEVVATGHTADDQAETMIMRLLRGCSLQGLGGIRARTCRRKEPIGLKLWRPVLHLKRHDLENFLKQLGQKWREDETNIGDKYFRNRVRHHVMPVLLEHGDNFAEHLTDLAKDLRATQSLIFRRALRYRQRYSSATELLLPRRADKLHLVLRREVLRQWLIELGLGETVTRAMILRLDNLWLTNASGRTVDYRKFSFIREKGRILFKKVVAA